MIAHFAKMRQPSPAENAESVLQFVVLTFSATSLTRSRRYQAKNAVWRLTLKLVFTHHSSFVTTTGPFPFSTWMMHGAIALPVKMNLTSIARLAEVARQFAESS